MSTIETHHICGLKRENFQTTVNGKNTDLFIHFEMNANQIDKCISTDDLIASIIRERFNWSNIFGTQCRLVSNKETITDANYVTRTLIFELTVPNSVVNTDNGTTRVINNVVRTGIRG